MFKPGLTDSQLDSIITDPKNRMASSALLLQLVGEYRRMKLALECLEDPPMLPPSREGIKEVIIDGVLYVPTGSEIAFA